MKKGTTSQAQERVDASPEVVYDLVTDVTRMGEWSPECVGCAWIDGANDPVPGARFRGRNRHGLARWSTNHAWSQRIDQRSSHSWPATQWAVT
jgi:Polyketide cyclase / dehydrase and lipid transport